MKMNYDPEADVFCVVFTQAELADADEIVPGVIASYSADGELVQLEVLNASKRATSRAAAQGVA